VEEREYVHGWNEKRWYNTTLQQQQTTTTKPKVYEQVCVCCFKECEDEKKREWRKVAINVLLFMSFVEMKRQ
jgi:hypothetical protein